MHYTIEEIPRQDRVQVFATSVTLCGTDNAPQLWLPNSVVCRIQCLSYTMIMWYAGYNAFHTQWLCGMQDTMPFILNDYVVCRIQCLSYTMILKRFYSIKRLKLKPVSGGPRIWEVLILLILKLLIPSHPFHNYYPPSVPTWPPTCPPPLHLTLSTRAFLT